jgi:hypothetical protein
MLPTFRNSMVDDEIIAGKAAAHFALAVFVDAPAS